MSDVKLTNPETSLEVDLMILDYFLCTTINAVLNEHIAQRSGHQTSGAYESLLGTFEGLFSSHPALRSILHMLIMASVILTMFKANHPGQYVPDELQIKLQILTFANLMFRRHIQSWWLPSGATLHDQRKKNMERAKRWMRCHSDSNLEIMHYGGSAKPVIPKSTLATNRRDMMSHLCVFCDQDFPDSEFCVSLLDILPEYVALCKMVPLNVTHSWMNGAVVFMLQAAIEQILIYGNIIEDSIDEAFAWDWVEVTGQVLWTSENNDAEASMWENKRISLKTSLLNNQRPTWEDHFRHLLTEFPLLHFDEMILELLSGLLKMLNTPVLMQLEAGKLDGLTVTETEAFKDRIGVN